jgi:hypothetical protein
VSHAIDAVLDDDFRQVELRRVYPAQVNLLKKIHHQGAKTPRHKGIQTHSLLVSLCLGGSVFLFS